MHKKVFKVKVTFESGKAQVFSDVRVTDFATLQLSDDIHLTTSNMRLWKRKGNVILGEEIPVQAILVSVQTIQNK